MVVSVTASEGGGIRPGHRVRVRVLFFIQIFDSLLCWCKKWPVRTFNNHLKLITSLLISNVSYGLKGENFHVPSCPSLSVLGLHLLYSLSVNSILTWVPLCLQVHNKIQRSWRTLIYSSIFLLTEQLRPSLEAVAGLAFWTAEAGLAVQSNSQLHSVR